MDYVFGKHTSEQVLFHQHKSMKYYYVTYRLCFVYVKYLCGNTGHKIAINPSGFYHEHSLYVSLYIHNALCKVQYMYILPTIHYANTWHII